MYLALATRPIVVQVPGTDFWKVTGWTELGPAVDMEDAKKRYGGSPVLVEVKE